MILRKTDGGNSADNFALPGCFAQPKPGSLVVGIRERCEKMRPDESLTEWMGMPRSTRTRLERYAGTLDDHGGDFPRFKRPLRRTELSLRVRVSLGRWAELH
jgi:hypothetical protein